MKFSENNFNMIIFSILAFSLAMILRRTILDLQLLSRIPAQGCAEQIKNERKVK